MTLREVLEVAAADDGIDAETTTAVDGTTAWSRDGTMFATLDAAGGTATFRLDPVLSAAARRTPDTGVGPAGQDWVRFSPAVLDGHAADRATAWFAAAWRRAGS